MYRTPGDLTGVNCYHRGRCVRGTKTRNYGWQATPGKTRELSPAVHPLMGSSSSLKSEPVLRAVGGIVAAARRIGVSSWELVPVKEGYGERKR